jgi:hypothetical protein
MIYSCAKCQKMFEDRSSDHQRNLCVACWKEGWRIDAFGNLTQPRWDEPTHNPRGLPF